MNNIPIERLIISNSGEVGIGNSPPSPNYNLTVSGNIWPDVSQPRTRLVINSNPSVSLSFEPIIGGSYDYASPTTSIPPILTNKQIKRNNKNKLIKDTKDSILKLSKKKKIKKKKYRFNLRGE